MIKRKSFIFNSLSNITTFSLTTIITFFLTPYLIQKIGTTQYGIWNLLNSVIGYYGFLDIGIASAVLRYVSFYIGKNDEKSINEVFSSSLVIFSSIGLIIIGISFIIAKPIANFFNINPGNVNLFTNILLFLSFAIGFTLPNKVLSAVLRAHEYFHADNVISIAEISLRGFFTFLVLFKGGTLLSVSIVYCITSIFTFILKIGLFIFYVKHIHFSIRSVKKNIIMQLYSFGFFIFIIKVGDLLRFNIDNIVIGKILNIDLIATYAVASIIMLKIMSLTANISVVTKPRLISYAGFNNQNKFKSSIITYSYVLSTIVTSLVTVSLLTIKDFLKLWIPPHTIDVNTASIIFILLMIGLLPDLMTMVSMFALEAIKKHKYIAYQTFVEGIFNLILSLILVRSYGLIGVALGTTIPILISKLIVQPILLCKFTNLNILDYLISVFFRPLSNAVIIIIISHIFLNFSVHSYLLLMLKAAIILTLFAVTAYITNSNPEVKQYIHDIVNTFLFTKKKSTYG